MTATLTGLALALGLAWLPAPATAADSEAPRASGPDSIPVEVGKSQSFSIFSDDAPGDTATFQIVMGPANGSIVGPSDVNCDVDGGCFAQVVYTPSGSFDDALTFTATDQAGHVSDSTTIRFDVYDPEGPRAFPGYQEVVGDRTTPVEVLGIDPMGASVTFTIVTSPVHGALGAIGPATCNDSGCKVLINYTPTRGFVGTDTFQYQVSSGAKTSDAAEFELSVTAPPKPAPPVVTRPGAPRIGFASAGRRKGPKTGLARWAAPASTGGSPITAYVVTATKYQGTKVLRTKTATVGASRRSYDMVVGAGKWRFRVAAVNRVGRGGFSGLSNLVKAR